MSEANPPKEPNRLTGMLWGAIGTIFTGLMTKLWNGLPSPLPGLLISLGGLLAGGWIANNLVLKEYTPKFAEMKMRLNSHTASPKEAAELNKRFKYNQNWALFFGIIFGLCGGVIIAVLLGFDTGLG